MDFNYLLYRIQKYSTNFFDIRTRAARKEFNTAIFFYSIIFLVLLYMVTDVSGINDVLQNKVGELQYQAYEGKITEQEAAEHAMKALVHFVPSTFMTCFSLLLLPLYIRRLNDITKHSIAFGFPLVVVYVFDAIQAVLGTSYSFYLYNTMSLYNFLLVALLCIYPSREN